MEAAAPLSRIMVVGDGLAANLTAAALARQVPLEVAIVRVGGGDAAEGDLFYGTVAAPGAHDVNLLAGIDERRLVLDSHTGFSWGTRYRDWGGRAWTQGFALPFPVIGGVAFQHYLARIGQAGIEPFLPGAQAARMGRFVHPPRDDMTQPLASAAYGYQLDPADYARLFAGGRQDVVAGELTAVETDHGGIAGVRLRDGEVLRADLYVDCTGPAARLLSLLEPDGDRPRRIGGGVRDRDGGDEAPLRTVTATATGWHSETPLRGRVRHLDVFAPGDAADGFDRRAEAALGRRARAWAGNCVGIGHAAAVVEPLTPAPLMLLERDVERLLTLIPASRAMDVERREYNRRFADDHDHALLFDRAFFLADSLPDGPYWQAARAVAVPDRLAHKVALFADRGVLASYDLEPFQPQDWVILHLGTGRHPQRHDRLADRADGERVRGYLASVRQAIDRAVATLPPSRLYRAQLEQYLRRGTP